MEIDENIKTTEQKKNTIVPALVLGMLLILTLPLIYLLVANVILPMGWSEPQTTENSDKPVPE